MAEDERITVLRRCLQTPPLRLSDEAVTIAIRDGFRCVYCQRNFLDSLDAWETWDNIEHLMPPKHGGDNTIENKVMSCGLCNRCKRDYPPQGATRTERIADAWSYVQGNLAKKRERWQKVSECVTAYRATHET